MRKYHKKAREEGYTKRQDLSHLTPEEKAAHYAQVRRNYYYANREACIARTCAYAKANREKVNRQKREAYARRQRRVITDEEKARNREYYRKWYHKNKLKNMQQVPEV